MYSVVKDIDVDFAHRVPGHPGGCRMIHGHTWRFQVCVASDHLDSTGFVIDFGDIKKKVLQPVKDLLDHSLLLSRVDYDNGQQSLDKLGEDLGLELTDNIEDELHEVTLTAVGARLAVCVSPFRPTSENLARWLYELACERLNDSRKRVLWARVYESLHPQQSYAEYSGR